MMINEHSSGIILATIITICFITTLNAEEVTNGESKATVESAPKVKRAWSGLNNPGWGKRANYENELNDEVTNEQLHRMLLKIYAELSKLNDEESEFNPDYDNAIDKRAWSQMANSGWGKRTMDWRGYGKRREWSKLQSAWGKK